MPTRIMFMSNELLALTDGSGAFASRLLIVLLTKSFYGKEDPGSDQQVGRRTVWHLELGDRRLSAAGRARFLCST